VHANWHDAVPEDIGTVALFGITQVVWQLAAVELHNIMQFVTADVTVEVCGVIGVWPTCASRIFFAAKAVPSIPPSVQIPDESAADTANRIATRRIIASKPPIHAWLARTAGHADYNERRQPS